MAKNFNINLDVFNTPLKELNLGSPLTFDPSCSLTEAVSIMQDKHIGSLLVVEENKLIGIVTERDFLLKVTSIIEDLEHTPVSQIMTHHPFHLNENDSVRVAMLEMHKNQFRHVPVVDESGAPLFVVSIKDLMDFVIKQLPKGLHAHQDEQELPDHDDL